MNQLQRGGNVNLSCQIKAVSRKSVTQDVVELETLPEKLVFPRYFLSWANYTQEKKSMKSE